MYKIENWWKHTGAYDRVQASPFCWIKGVEDIADFFQKTDDWWESLSNEEKIEIYEDFFSED